MLAGSMVVSYISTPLATWVSLIILLTIHLGTNYLAVRSVSMRTINRQRANIIFNKYMSSRHGSRRMLIPEEVSQLERIFEWDGVLRCGGEVSASLLIFQLWPVIDNIHTYWFQILELTVFYRAWHIAASEYL